MCLSFRATLFKLFEGHKDLSSVIFYAFLCGLARLAGSLVLLSGVEGRGVTRYCTCHLCVLDSDSWSVGGRAGLLGGLLLDIRTSGCTHVCPNKRVG